MMNNPPDLIFRRIRTIVKKHYSRFVAIASVQVGFRLLVKIMLISNEYMPTYKIIKTMPSALYLMEIRHA